MNKGKISKIGKYVILGGLMLSLEVNNVVALTKPNYVTNINSSSANLIIEGVNNVKSNEEFSLNVVLDNIKGSNLMGIQGDLEILDNNCVSLLSLESMNSVVAYNNKFVYSDFDGFNSKTNLVKVKLKAGQNACNTIISVNSIKMSFVDGTRIKYEDSANIVVNVTEENNIEVISRKNEIANEVVDELKESKGEIIIPQVESKNTIKEVKINKVEIPEVKKINYLELFTRRMTTYKDNLKKFINIYFN